MNFVKALDNKFVQELFPYGLHGDVCIGRLSLEIDRIYIDIHTRQKPEINVPKYGEWGVNFHVMVIHTIAQGIIGVNITNWQEPLYAKLVFDKKQSYYSMLLRGKSWSIDLNFEGITFQRCSTYLLSEDNN